MYTVKPLIIAALVATASATYFNGEALRREVLVVRQTITTTFQTTSTGTVSSVITPYPTATVSTNSSDVCSSVLNGLDTVLTGLPKPTGALSSYLATAATTLTDPCVSPNFPALKSSPYKPALT